MEGGISGAETKGSNEQCFNISRMNKNIIASSSKQTADIVNYKRIPNTADPHPSPPPPTPTHAHPSQSGQYATPNPSLTLSVRLVIPKITTRHISSLAHLSSLVCSFPINKINGTEKKTGTLPISSSSSFSRQEKMVKTIF